MKALFIFIMSVLALACAGVSEPEPTPVPLKCDNGGLLDTPDGQRLLVQCNKPVANPPTYCELVAEADYSCNIYHASQGDCETFPGLCKPPE